MNVPGQAGALILPGALRVAEALAEPLAEPLAGALAEALAGGDAGAAIQALNQDRIAPDDGLLLAVEQGSDEFARACLARGCSPIGRNAACVAAAECGDLQTIRLLVAAVTSTAGGLVAGARRHAGPVVQYLLDRGEPAANREQALMVLARVPRRVPAVGPAAARPRRDPPRGARRVRGPRGGARPGLRGAVAVRVRAGANPRGGRKDHRDRGRLPRGLGGMCRRAAPSCAELRRAAPSGSELRRR